MPRDPTLTRLLDDAERVATGPDVYQLPKVRGASSASRRVDLVLALLQQVQGAVLVCEDHPVADGELPGEWVSLAPHQWRVPDVPLDLGELLDWLSAGNWQLYGFADATAVTTAPPLNLFHRLEDSVANFQAVGASWVIDVFHDDEPWRLALA